ncbi:MAG: hypothetical protein NZ742_04705 [Acidobacteria bacterium]|nr:hypothetical protein [Acidobacteriota bacterium]MDW7983737.1 hypothetical protein [Acidobacteriota bacterium]
MKVYRWLPWRGFRAWVLAAVFLTGTAASSQAQWTVLVAGSTVTINELYDADGTRYRPDPTFKIEVPYWFVLAQYTTPVKGVADELSPAFTVGALTLFGNVKVTSEGTTVSSGLVPFWFWTYGTLSTKYFDLTGAYVFDISPRPVEPDRISATNQSDEIILNGTVKYPLSLPKGSLTVYGGVYYIMTLVHQDGEFEVDPGDLTVPTVGVTYSYPIGEKTNLTFDLQVRRRGFGPVKLNGREVPDTDGHQWTLFPSVTLSYGKFFLTWVLVGLQDEWYPHGFTLSGKNGVAQSHLDFRIHLGYSF